jgi:hypothetical protein
MTIRLLMIATSLVLAGCKTTSLPVPHVERIEQNRTTLSVAITGPGANRYGWEMSAGA